MPVVRPVGREVDGVAAVSEHHIDFVISIPVRHKCDLLPVRREAGLTVIRRVAREGDQVRPVTVHEVDVGVAITVRVKHDLALVG
jgi:hypothetical protein